MKMSVDLQLPDDVMKDLVTLHQAGEASPGTARLVEQYLREHPDLAARLATPLPVAPPAAASKDDCLKAMRSTQRLIAWRMAVMGFALVTMLVPMTFRVDSTGFHPLFLGNAKFVIASVSVSAWAWCVYVYLSERLRRTGLR
jgi:hypothetical protein